MSAGSIFILLLIFGWIAFLIYSRVKKRRIAKAAAERGVFVCAGGCSGCSKASLSTGCCGASFPPPNTQNSSTFSSQECSALKLLEQLETLDLNKETQGKEDISSIANTAQEKQSSEECPCCKQ